MAKKNEEEEELKDQIPSVVILIKDGEDYGLDNDGKRFYKYQERWYLVDNEDNVKRIK